MADYDVVADPLPHLVYQDFGQHPTTAELKAAIAGSGVAAKYPAAFMFSAPKNDLIYICRLEGISVNGL